VWSLGISVIEVALGRFPFMESSSDDEDDDDDDDLPEELRGTLSPTQLEAQVNRRPHEDKDKTNTNGRKPKSSGKRGGGGNSQMSILDLLQHIVNEPAPKLPRDDARFKPEMCEFVDLCLRKDPSARPSPKELTKHEYVKNMEIAKVDLLGWVKTLKV
jgi:mitogen-activated protein kinase kinase